jgi:hypothetical protein
MFPSKIVINAFVIAASVGVAHPVAGQELLELARAHARQYPGLPVQIPSGPGHYESKTVDELTREAVAVVQARVSRIRSYVGGSRGDRVLTDYLITEPGVIAGRLAAAVQPVPGPGTTPILTVYGGEVVLDGVTVRCTETNREAIKDGGQYLIFLRPARGTGAGPGRYEIYHGGIFEVLQDELKPLLKKARDVFPEFINQRPQELVARVRNAAQPR